jgi:hypothetical protein
VEGKTSTAPLTVHEDPRIGESAAAMEEMRAQFELEAKITEGTEGAGNPAAARRSNRRRKRARCQSEAGSGLLSAAASGPCGVPAYTGNPGFTGINGSFAGLMVIVDYMSDHAPVDAQVRAYHDYCTDPDANLALWRSVNTQELPADLACGTVPAGLP